MKWSVAIVIADIEIASKDKTEKTLKIGFHISNEPQRGLWSPSTVHQGGTRCDFYTSPDPHYTETGTARKWVGTMSRTYFHKHKPRAPSPVLPFRKMGFTFSLSFVWDPAPGCWGSVIGAGVLAYLERRLCSLVKWEVAWPWIFIG